MAVPLYNRPEYQAARARHAKRMKWIGIIQIVLVVTLVVLKIYIAMTS